MKLYKEDLYMFAIWLTFMLSFACVGLATMAEKAGNTVGFVFSIIGFGVLFSATLFGAIYPQLREVK